MLMFLCSCQFSEKEMVLTENLPLDFSIEQNLNVKTLTRGKDLINNNLQSITVFGFYSGNSILGSSSQDYAVLFDAQEIIKDESSIWRYSPLKYWFKSGYHHFFAFASNGAMPSITMDERKCPSINYVVPSNVNDQLDLLWSFGPTINCTYEESSLSKIKFSMNHALTRISFSAAVSESFADGNVKIEKISLKNIFSSGESYFSFNDIEITDASWVVNNETISEFVVHTGNEDTDGGLIKDLWLTTDIQSLNTSNGILYLLPQLLSGRDGIDNAIIEIHFRTEHDQILRVIETNLPAPSDNRWKPGQAIEYKLNYNGGGDTPFNILGVVSPWVDQIIDIALPATYLNISTGSITLSSSENYKLFFYSDASDVTISSTPIINNSVLYDTS